MKKNITKVLVFMIAILLIFSNFVVATTGTTIATTVRLREEPDSSSTTLMLIGEGKTVEILSEDGDWYEVEYDGVTGYIAKDYISVDSDSDEGTTTTDTTASDTEETTDEELEEMDANAVASAGDESEQETTADESDTSEEVVQEETEETTEDDDSYNTLTLAEDTNIRYVPSFTSNISNTIGSGSEVTILMTLNKWVKITDGNVTGWVVRQNI